MPSLLTSVWITLVIVGLVKSRAQVRTLPAGALGHGVPPAPWISSLPKMSAMPVLFVTLISRVSAVPVLLSSIAAPLVLSVIVWLSQSKDVPLTTRLAIALPSRFKEK